MSNDFGYVDYSRPGATPNFPEETPSATYTSSRDLRPTGSYEMYYHNYSQNSRPTVVKTQLWGKNGYYMNGPTIDPFNHAITARNQLLAYTQSWQEPAQRNALERFSQLLNRYGNTNSAGTLWALAAGSYDVEDATIQKVLETDAKTYADQYRQSAPVRAGSPAATADAESPEEGFMDNMWQPFEFLSRNIFSALSMPMEAVQGALRGIGGELTDQDAEWLDFDEGRLTGALAQLGSLVNPLIALAADRVRGDNEFINPWEQTDFGQTLLTASAGGGWDAFTTLQAGLDVTKAKDELSQLPEFAGMNPAELDAAAVDYAKRKGYYSEPGWFIDETSVVGESQRRATFDAWAIPGPDDQMTAWTLGRGIAGSVVGPDSEAYGVMSGFIDAVAAIALDPTIIAGKFGIPSKTIRGISTLARGEQGAILIGKEARKAIQNAENVTRQLRKAQELAAKGDRAQAERLVTGELTRQFGRTPTREEIAAAIDEPIEINPDDLARMEVGELADLTRTAERARATDETMSAIRINQDKVSLQMRDARRARVEEQRLGNIVTNEATDVPVERPEEARNMWNSYIGRVFTRDAEGNQVYNPTGVNDFARDVLQYDERLGTWSDIEARTLFDGLVDLYRAWTGGKDEGLKSYQSMREFGDAFDNINIGKIKRPVTVAPEQVERDLTRMYLQPDFEDILTGLRDSGYTGTILDAVPQRGTPVVGVVDGADSLVYWGGTRTPSLVAAGEIIPAATRRMINRKVQQVLSDPSMRFVDEIEDFDSVVGQTRAKINAAADPRGQVEALLASEDLTWGRLLVQLSNYGLDGYLSDVMAGLKKRVDGITDIDNVPGRTWLGDDARAVSYAVNPAAKINADTIRTAADVEDALRTLELQGIDIAETGVRNLGISEIEALRRQSGTKADQLLAGLAEYRASQVVNAARQDEALGIVLRSIDDKYVDPEKALKATIGWQAGLRTSRVNGITLDEAGVRAFLFGVGPTSHLGNRALDALSDFIPVADREKALDLGADSDFYQGLLQRSVGELALLTGSKWSGDLYRRVAENAIEGNGRSGLIDILAPRLGIDISPGDIAKTTQVTMGDNKTWFRTFRRPTGPLARALGQMPTPRKVDLQDSGQVAEAIFLYGRYAKIGDDFIADQIGRVMLNEGKFEAAAINRNALTSTFDQISSTLLENIEQSGTVRRLFRGEKGKDRKQQIKDGIYSSTRLFLGGETDERSLSKELYANAADVPRIITSDGKEIVLPSIQLETEIAQGYVGLPSIEQWESAIKKFTSSAELLVDRFESAAAVRDLARRFFDNVFRAGLLAFRIAYIARNVAEMQVRMFLNGHKSLLSDPATMIGMTFGNSVTAKRTNDYRAAYQKASQEITATKGAKATRDEIEAVVGPPPQSKLDKMFSPYRNTVLDTSFEVGENEALAILNEVEDYFSLTRSAHSLTDPRVYNAGVRQGWRPVAYQTDSAKFNQGWAYELMMLQRDDIVRFIIGGKDSQFASIQSAGDALDTRIRMVRSVMFDEQFENSRAKLVAADARFADIFADEDATMQYLFTAQNSVQNRIRKLTGGNSELLDYIRTGEMRYPGGVLRPRSIGDEGDRVRRFSRVLKDNYNGTDSTGFNWEQHFVSNSVTVPWVDDIDARQGVGLMNKFFQVAAKFERLGAVGPEFRMAYWDRVAELAPALRGKDVDRALRGAETTLSVLKRMNPDGKLVDIGSNHPAWSALSKAKKNEQDGFLTLDEIHEIAMSYAAEEVAGLFYDAARRNNLWYKMRLIVPFGQAWGNTLNVWTQLAAKKPIQVYKAQKALNAMIESGSSAIYDAGQEMLAYGQYAPGFAPWEQDTNGGFFYTNSYGQTSFMFPFVGRLAAAPMKVWGAMTGVPTPDELSIQSPATSLNLAMGGDSILPGIGPVGAAAINMLPDDVLTSQVAQLSSQVNPFGEKNILEAGIPAWFSKLLGGVGALPVVGEGLAPALDVLAESNKNKHLRESFAILSTTGNYPDMMTNPDTQRRFQEDAVALSRAMLFTTGLIQNFLPATPIPEEAVRLQGDEVQGSLEDQNPTLYTIGMLNSMFQQYLPRNGYDASAAREEFVRDFGPAALFATTGDWKSFSRRPTSQALRWAQDNPDIAKANIDEFQLFFPQGDSSDVASQMWLMRNTFGTQQRKNADELFNEVVGFLESVQRSRINSMEANGIITDDEAEAAREEVNKRYIETGDVAGRFINRTDEMLKLREFVGRYGEIQTTDAGTAFMKAWVLREEALTAARELTGRDDATLGSKETFPILQWYITKINEIQMAHPDFVLLATKFRREWE